MQKLHRPGLAIRRVPHRGERPFVVIPHSQHVPVVRVAFHNLQTARLLVLADVQPPVPQHPCHLAIHRADVGDVTGADRLMDNVERLIGQSAQVVHRRLERCDLQSPAGCFALVECQHLGAEIDHGHPCPGGRVQDRLPAPTTRQAQHVEPGDRRGQPASTIEGLQRLAAFVVGGHLRKRAPPADHLAVRLPVAVKVPRHRSPFAGGWSCRFSPPAGQR